MFEEDSWYSHNKRFILVTNVFLQKGNANSTQCSQAVTHPSTDWARRCLTSVIGRELVYSAWYGRWLRSKGKGSVYKLIYNKVNFYFRRVKILIHVVFCKRFLRLYWIFTIFAWRKESAWKKNMQVRTTSVFLGE